MQANKGTAQLDMTLFLKELPDGVFGRMEYRDELYSPATMTRMADMLTCNGGLYFLWSRSIHATVQYDDRRNNDAA